MIFRSDVTRIVDILVVFEPYHNATCLAVGDDMRLPLNCDGFTLEVAWRGFNCTFTQSVACFALECTGEVRVTFIGNDGEYIDIVNFVAEQFLILTYTVTVNGDSQTASHFLTLGSRGVAMPERTYLEYIGIIPTLAQGRVRKDEACRFIKTQQSLFVAQDKVVVRRFLADIAASLGLGLNHLTFLVD